MKKVKVPTVQMKDLYMGATITVYSRQLKIVEYGDNFTENVFHETRQYTFVLVKPGALHFLGKVVNAAIKSGFAVAKSKMAVLSPGDANALYGSREGDAAGAPSHSHLVRLYACTRIYVFKIEGFTSRLCQDCKLWRCVVFIFLFLFFKKEMENKMVVNLPQ